MSMMRGLVAGFFKSFTGPLEVPAVEAEALKASRGVGGHWVSWPGVDTSPAAPTIVYLHGGGLLFGTALYTQGTLLCPCGIAVPVTLTLTY